MMEIRFFTLAGAAANSQALDTDRDVFQDCSELTVVVKVDLKCLELFQRLAHFGNGVRRSFRLKQIQIRKFR